MDWVCSHPCSPLKDLVLPVMKGGSEGYSDENEEIAVEVKYGDDSEEVNSDGIEVC